MASWLITKDHTEKIGDSECLTGKMFWTDDRHAYENKDQKFRMYDDDKILYYEGFAYIDEENETGFEPLDWGTAYAGCTRIEYWNTIKRCWELL